MPPTTQEPSLSVIVPTWNGRELLAACLQALRNSRGPAFEVVVVDDASSDGTWDWLSHQTDPRIRSLRNESNLGFARSMNKGFQLARGRWLVPLNNDTRVRPSFLEELVKCGESGFDMVAPRVLLAGGSEVDSAGVTPLRDGSSIERGRARPAEAPELLAPTEVFGPSASACLYSRRVLDATHGFDEDFYAYYEDVDLAWRARHAGLRCMYWPAAVVEHRHSATWGRVSDRKLYLLERNRLWTLWKNYPFRWVAAEPVARFITLAPLVARGPLGPEVGTGLRAMRLRRLARILGEADLAAWAGYPMMWRKRQRIWETSRLSRKELARWIR